MKEWLGYPIKEWQHGKDVADFSKQVFRISYSFTNNFESLSSVVQAFLKSEGVEACPGIILGDFEDPDELAESGAILVDHKDKLPNLKALYIGETDFQISWINQGAVKPILEAFPGLEELYIQGSNGLTWESCRHICLKKLVIESGGLSKDVLHGILNSVLPELEHLELWLGTEEYGWSGTAEDVKGFLYENPFPKLKYLGLTNCDDQTEIAQLAAEAPLLDRLEVLDLSRGVLKDEGGEALLQSDKIKNLKHLDLNYHYMSDNLVGKFKASGLSVDVSSQEVADIDEWDGETNTYYYVSVGE